MDKIPFIRLWDVYRGLLTPTQQEICDLYFNFDLTLSEIAEQKGITRQGVSECLKTCRKQLEEYESKLHFSERLTKISLEESFLLTDVNKWAEKIKPVCPHEIEELEEILERDYSEEVERALEKPENVAILNADYTHLTFKSKKTGEEGD